MNDVRFITLDGVADIVESRAIRLFEESLRGPLIRSDDARYHSVRKVWNGVIESNPTVWKHLSLRVAVALALALPIGTLLRPPISVNAQAADADDAVGEFVHYVSDKRLISFEHPADWTLTEREDDIEAEDDIGVTVESSEGCAHTDTSFFIEIINEPCRIAVIYTDSVEELQLESVDPVEILSLVVEEFLAEVDMQTGLEALDLNGKAAATISYTFDSSVGRQIVYLTLIIHHGRVALLAGGTMIETREEFLPQLERIRDSIVLAPTLTPTPSLRLSGPAAVVRGDSANYQIINIPSGAAFANWRFVGDGITITRPGNNNVASWQGTMVQSGVIRVDVTTAGGTQTLSLAVTVNPRPWTENDPPVPLGRAGNGPLSAIPRANQDLGITIPKYNRLRPDRTVGFVNSGPNEGFSYVLAPPVIWNPEAFSNEALYDHTHPFFRAHDAGLRGAPLPDGRVSIGELQAAVEAHEGIIGPLPGVSLTSHWQQQRDFLAIQTNQINIPLENDISHSSKETRTAYRNRILGTINARINSALQAWENQGEPHTILSGTKYFDYPVMMPRSLTLQANGGRALVLIQSTRGATLISNNPAVVTVQETSRGLGYVIALAIPISAGSTTIRVTNDDGEWDEIPVTVVPG